MNSTAWHTFVGREERRPNSRTQKDGEGGDGGKVWSGRKGGRGDRGGGVYSFVPATYEKRENRRKRKNEALRV